MCLATRQHVSGCRAPTYRSSRRAFSSRLPASYIQDVFRTSQSQPPLNVATALQTFGFPLITDAHVERWANRDGTFGVCTATHDNTDLSAEETLRQLARMANITVLRADPACLAETLLAAESQQRALDSVWPQCYDVDQGIAGWNYRLPVDLEGLGRQHWWIKKTDEVYMDGDSELKAAQRERVINVLLPFVAGWRLASRTHRMNSALCKDCS
ncbi:hypothetical protein HD806DRAFT_410864 [Xylariaceae sp. AK1471]|nr:hypothetical protein HD806DRAFT_410864 [Xylariaceae sp. AK1471]